MRAAVVLSAAVCGFAAGCWWSWSGDDAAVRALAAENVRLRGRVLDLMSSEDAARRALARGERGERIELVEPLPVR